MIRVLAVTGVFLVATGMGLPRGVSAQTPAQGQAVRLLFLLGASTGAQASAKTAGQKPKPAIAGSHEAEDRIADVKQKPPSVKDGIPDKVTRPSDRLDGTVLRVTSDVKNAGKLDRPVALTDRTRAKHN